MHVLNRNFKTHSLSQNKCAYHSPASLTTLLKIPPSSPTRINTRRTNLVSSGLITIVNQLHSNSHNYDILNTEEVQACVEKVHASLITSESKQCYSGIQQ